MGILQAMLKYLYQKRKDRSILPKHLEAPLLEERTAFLEEWSTTTSDNPTELRLVAEILLLIVTSPILGGDAKQEISFDDLMLEAEKWKQHIHTKPLACKKEHVIEEKTREYYKVSVLFLDKIGKLDSRYRKGEIILKYRPTRNMVEIIKWLNAPMLDERLAYIKELEQKQYKPDTVRAYMFYQAAITSELGLVEPRTITESELLSAARSWRAKRLSYKVPESQSSVHQFTSVGKSWLSFLGIYVASSEGIKHVTAWAPYINAYEKWLLEERGLKSNTVTAVDSRLRIFAEWFDSKSLSFKSLSIADVDSFFFYFGTSGYAKETIRHEISDVSAFLNYSFVQKWVDTDLAPLINPVLTYRLDTLPNAIPWDDVKRLRDFYSGDSKSELRSNAIVEMVCEYGFRTSEIVNLNIQDIDWEKDEFFIRHTKEGPVQKYQMTPAIGNKLLRYVTESRNNECEQKALFITLRAPYARIYGCTIRAIFAFAYDALGIEVRHNGAHAVRHSVATHMVNEGQPLDKVGEMLGHKTMSSTMIYTKVDLRNLRQVSDIDWEGLI